MDQQRRNQIHSEGEAILQGCPESFGQGLIVNMETIVKGLGGDLVRLEKDQIEFEALIFKDEDSFKVHLHKDANPQRERFSIAHEIGHLILHMGFKNPDRTTWNTYLDGEENAMARHGTSELEYEANEFAGALLMPKQKFIKQLDAHSDMDDGSVDIRAIAKAFGVSRQAARLRGQWLDLIEW